MIAFLLQATIRDFGTGVKWAGLASRVEICWLRMMEGVKSKLIPGGKGGIEGMRALEKKNGSMGQKSRCDQIEYRVGIRRVLPLHTLLTWASFLVSHSHFLRLWNKENKTGLMPLKYVVEQLIFTKRCHTGTQYLLNLFFFRFHPFYSQVIYVTNYIYTRPNILKIEKIQAMPILVLYPVWKKYGLCQFLRIHLNIWHCVSIFLVIMNHHLCLWDCEEEGGLEMGDGIMSLNFRNMSKLY